jgi:hypothetical protein
VNEKVESVEEILKEEMMKRRLASLNYRIFLLKVSSKLKDILYIVDLSDDREPSQLVIDLDLKIQKEIKDLEANDPPR